MITHPEKILFPDDGITKGELASYYEAIAPLMLPHICGRPITMERYHRGIDRSDRRPRLVAGGIADAELQPVDRPDPPGLHHGDGQHAADRP